MAVHGQISLDNVMDVSVTDAESLIRALGWQIELFGGKVLDVRDNCLLVRFGEREWTIGIQEVGLWGTRRAATRDAKPAMVKVDNSPTVAGFRARARAREKLLRS